MKNTINSGLQFYTWSGKITSDINYAYKIICPDNNSYDILKTICEVCEQPCPPSAGKWEFDDSGYYNDWIKIR